MTTFSVNSSDDLTSAVNYLLSGSASIGQSLTGFNNYAPAYLTGNYRLPFSVPTVIRTCTGNSGENTIQVQPNSTGLGNGTLVSGAGIGGPGYASIEITDQTDNTGTTLILSEFNTTKIAAPLTFTPFYPGGQPKLYVPPVAVSSVVQLDPTSFKFTFAATQIDILFQPGQNVYGASFSNDYYNGSWAPIGVAECTYDYVILKSPTPSTQAPDTTGTLSTHVTRRVDQAEPGGDNSAFNSTDANARAIVSGGQQRAFVSAQLFNTMSYTATTATDMTYTVAVNRYVGFNASNTNTPDYRFLFDTTVSQQQYYYTGLTGTATLDPVETTFSTMIDTPSPGYYWYIVEVSFYITNSGDLAITDSVFGPRSLSAQVLKA